MRRQPAWPATVGIPDTSTLCAEVTSSWLHWRFIKRTRSVPEQYCHPGRFQLRLIHNIMERPPAYPECAGRELLLTLWIGRQIQRSRRSPTLRSTASTVMSFMERVGLVTTAVWRPQGA